MSIARATSTMGSISGNGIINVRDKGVKGDGIMDDTAAINALITRVSTAGGGILFFPAGTYLVSASYLTSGNGANKQGIQLASNIHILGAGKNATGFKLANSPAGVTVTYVSPGVFTTNGTFSPVFNGVSVSNVIIEGLSIDGNQANQANFFTSAYQNPSYGSTLTCPGIQFINGSGNLVRDCDIHHCQGYGVDFLDCQDSSVINSILRTNGNGGGGCHTLTGGQNSTGSGYFDCTAYDNYSDNFRLEARGGIVQGCHSRNTRGDTAGNNNYAGIYVESTGFYNRICNNICHDNSAFGIDVNGPYTVISGNSVYQNSNGGIQIGAGGGDHNIITGNNVRDNGQSSTGNQDAKFYNPFGICPNGGNNNISGNIITNTLGHQTWGIGNYTGSISHTLMIGNTILGHTGGPIQTIDGTCLSANNLTA